MGSRDDLSDDDSTLKPTRSIICVGRLSRGRLHVIPIQWPIAAFDQFVVAERLSGFGGNLQEVELFAAVAISSVDRALIKIVGM